jgi:hypothetical protein
VAKHYCNRRTARSAILVILILSIVVNFPLFLYTSLRIYCTQNGSVPYYGLVQSSLLHGKYFSRLFYPTMVTISLLIPWLICFLIWFFLIRALHSAQSQLTSKNVQTSFRNDRKQDTYFRITLMIVCVLTVYMICRSAHLFDTIYIIIQSSLSVEIRFAFNRIRIKLSCISNIMLTINHAANFYIYSINPKFRLTLKLYLTYYFRQCRVKRRRAFTVFHLRRKKTDDSLDGLSIQNDFNRSIMLTTPNMLAGNHNPSPNLSVHAGLNQPNRTANTLRTPQKYLKQFINPHSIHENSEKSYVWREIEEKLKHHRRTHRP